MKLLLRKSKNKHFNLADQKLDSNVFSIIQSILTQHPIPENENPERWLWELKDPKQLVDYNVTSLGVPLVEIMAENG